MNTVYFAFIVILTIIILFGISLTIYGVSYNMNKNKQLKTIKEKSYPVAPSTTSIQGNYKINELNLNNLTVNTTVKIPYGFETLDLRSSDNNEFFIDLVNTKQNVVYSILFNRSSVDIRKIVYIVFPETNNRFNWNISINVFQWANLVKGNEIIFKYPRNYILKSAYTVDFETPCSQTTCNEVLITTVINENYWMNLSISGEINSRITLTVTGTNVFRQMSGQSLLTSRMSNINNVNTNINFNNSGLTDENVSIQCNNSKTSEYFNSYINLNVPTRFFKPTVNKIKKFTGRYTPTIDNLINDGVILSWDVSTQSGTLVLPEYTDEPELYAGTTWYIFKYGTIDNPLTIQVSNTRSYLNTRANSTVNIFDNLVIYTLILAGNTFSFEKGWFAMK